MPGLLVPQPLPLTMAAGSWYGNLIEKGPLRKPGVLVPMGAVAALTLWTLVNSCYIWDAPKPVIGRINGHAFGGGLGLTAACDLTLAADAATFAFSEVRVGVIPAIISVLCIPKLGIQNAMWLFLTGERISATSTSPAVSSAGNGLDRLSRTVVGSTSTAMATRFGEDGGLAADDCV